MPEDSDYTPSPWTTHSTFDDARKAYDAHAGRSYSDAVSKGIAATDLVPAKVKTMAESPIVILCDVTGSMGEWPATIFSKLPYLDNEAKFYFGEDYEMCFGAIGDAYSDKYPLQVQPFGKGTGLADTLAKLVIEGNGGGQSNESYDLGAIYFARNCEMPKAIRPLLIFIGDEGVYPDTIASQAKACAKIEGMKESLTMDEVFTELKKKFDVYIVRKTYLRETEHKIRGQWVYLLGEDHVAPLDDAARVVDVIFGIFAKVTGKIDDFKKELAERQGKDKGGDKKIETTLKALNTIHRDAGKSTKKLTSGTKSITRRRGPAGKTSKSLLDDD